MVGLDVVPNLSFNDFLDGRRMHTITSREHFTHSVSFFPELPNAPDLLLGKLGVPDLFAFDVPPLSHAIVRIFGGRAKKQVPGIHACPVVTSMTDKHSIGDGPFLFDPDPLMDPPSFPFSADLGVSAFVAEIPIGNPASGFAHRISNRMDFWHSVFLQEEYKPCYAQCQAIMGIIAVVAAAAAGALIGYEIGN